MSIYLRRIFVSALIIVGGVGHAIEACDPDLAVLDKNKTTVTNDGRTISIGGIKEWICQPR